MCAAGGVCGLGISATSGKHAGGNEEAGKARGRR